MQDPIISTRAESKGKRLAPLQVWKLRAGSLCRRRCRSGAQRGWECGGTSLTTPLEPAPAARAKHVALVSDNEKEPLPSFFLLALQSRVPHRQAWQGVRSWRKQRRGVQLPGPSSAGQSLRVRDGDSSQLCRFCCCSASTYALLPTSGLPHHGETMLCLHVARCSCSTPKYINK